MDPPSWEYEAFEDRVATWAADRPDIRAVVVIGSRARDDRPADTWSDLDLVLVATDPDRYRERTDWLRDLGDPWLSFREGTAVGGLTERRVLFDPGLDVDFVPIAPDAVDPTGDLPDEVAAVLGRGYRFLVDEDGLADSFADRLDGTDIGGRGPALPDEDAFVETVHDGWYHAVWVAKKLRRGEVWTAKDGLDGYLKRECLVPVLAWHARAVHGRRPWHAGRFLEEWADERAIEELRDAFADYDEADCWRALFATADLFRRFARETADALGYDYPDRADDRVTALVEELAPPR